MKIAEIKKGEMRNFRAAESIASRIVFREEVGKSEKGTVEAALAYNPDGPRNAWLVALVLVNGAVWARAPFGQAVRLESRDKAVKGWQRAIGYQLRKMIGEEWRLIWRSQNPDQAKEALTRIWPTEGPAKGG